MPFGGGGSNEAALARKEEQERQERIRAGTRRINNIFDGGTFGTDAVAAGSVFDPKATYFLADGTTWTPTLPLSVAASEPAKDTAPPRFGGRGMQEEYRGGSPDGSGSSFSQEDWGGEGGRSSVLANAFGVTAPPQTAAEEFAKLVKEGKLYGGTTTQSGFDDDFFAGRRDAYMDYHVPQLEEQYGNAGRELTFALARGGNLNSSVRGDKLSELQKLYDRNKQMIADQALAYENQTRTAVEDARGNLIATLNATGDAQGAANAALSRAAVLSRPDQFSPLGQLFVDFTAGLGTQAAQERAYAAGGPAPRYNLGLFGNPGRVTVR